MRGLPIYVISPSPICTCGERHLYANRASAICSFLQAPATQAAIRWLDLISIRFTLETTPASLSISALHVVVAGPLDFQSLLIFSVVSSFLRFFVFTFYFFIYFLFFICFLACISAEAEAAACIIDLIYPSKKQSILSTYRMSCMIPETIPGHFLQLDYRRTKMKHRPSRSFHQHPSPQYIHPSVAGILQGK